ncbi:MAG: serine/threonine protein kinase [Planctomycetaceae bacterium]|nr:serine/threonine protein kinase [Planctomycetaceae bacterium]
MQCPDSDTIESFLAGTLAAGAHEQLEAHLEECNACQRVLSELAATAPLPWCDANASPEWSPEIAGRLCAGMRDSGRDSDNEHETDGDCPEFTELRLPFSIGDYELQEVIGRGGMGTVYRARQLKLNRVVAVKMIIRQHLKPSLVDRFYVEARAAGKLDHPGIVPVYDVGQFGPYVYYAMALVPGGTLSELVAQRRPSAQAAADVVRMIAEAVQYAHERGVIHRDLKPSNILLESERQPKVADFGLAKQLEASSDLTASGDVLGTPGYMPPEQAGGQSGVTTAADIYGLGAILYHLLTGKAPFEGQDPVAVIYRVVNEEPASIIRQNPDVPLDLETIALHCLAKHPEERYESAGEVARELKRFLSGEPIHVRPLSAFGRTVRWCRRSPAMAAMTFAAMAALLGGAAFSTYFGLLANERSRTLTAVNENLTIAERDARRSADDARAKAELATRQANTTLSLLESTLYELQPILSNDPALQLRRRKLLQSVLAGLDELHADSATEQRIRRCRANTLLGLAGVTHQVGDETGRTGLTASRPLFTDAFERLHDLHQTSPDDAAAAEDLLAAVLEFSNILADASEWKAARDYAERTLAASQRLSVTAESSSDFRLHGRLVEFEVLYGETLMRTGEMSRAKELLDQANRRCQAVLPRAAHDTYVHRELVHSFLKLGDWHLQKKEWAVAGGHFEKMAAEAKKIVERQPGQSKAIMDVSTALGRLGDVSQSLQQPDKALVYYQESLEYAEAAARMAPENDFVQWQLSFSYQELADCHLRAKRFREARTEALRCMEIRSRLAKVDTANPHLYTKLFHAQKAMATACEREGDLAEAIECHRQRIQFAEQFAAATQTQRHAVHVKQAQQEIDRLEALLAAREQVLPPP